MRLAGVSALVLLAVGLSVPSTSAAQAAVETCRGEAATLVGTGKGGSLNGTEGDDVIVTNGANSVDALGGDDVICITGGGSIEGNFINAGRGDDVVDGSENTGYGQIRLGSGRDTFLGGPDRDVLVLPEDGVRDVVDTLGGNDQIYTGARGTTLDDDIDTGADADIVYLRALPGSGSVDLGSDDGDQVYVVDKTRLRWRIDMRRAEISAGGHVMPFAGVELVSLSSLQWRSLEFLGDRDDETLSLGRGRGQESTDGPADVDLGRGDDRFAVTADVAGSYRGGPGRDQLGIEGLQGARESRARVDLARGRFRVDDGPKVTIPGFEDLILAPYGRVKVVGTGADNKVIVKGCHATVMAGRGDDDLRLLPFESCADPVLRAYGEDGDDTLRGTDGDDVLIGGPGKDTADGGPGQDSCVAEVETSC